MREASTAPRFFLATFGCRTNQADSSAIREDFRSADYRETDDHREAEVIVLNSCTVTHRSDQQVRQLARRMLRENPTARLLITGCYAQRSPEILASIPGVAAVVGNTWKDELVRLAEDPRTSPGDSEPAARVYRDDFKKLRRLEPAQIQRAGGRTRPVVKLQDGCDAKCAYCIIPSVRGPSRSVPPDRVVDQVGKLIAEGFREIVLTGIHIGTYGLYLDQRCPLDVLLARLVELPGLGRLRLSSIEPMELSRRVIDLAASTERIAPHFHICLQSGSDRVLRRMLRPYDTERFMGIVETIRQRIPHSAIGTDVIVGFPGETEQDHGATLEFLGKAPFTYFHVFPYSDRPGTRSSHFSDKLSSDVIKGRAAEVRALGVRKLRQFRLSQLGRELEVLTLAKTRRGWREALAGNYLKALVPIDLPENELLRGEAKAQMGEYITLQQLRPS